ncbi:MAG TPA: copper-binding protein [Terriglobales bacterium]|nr:copper-binding protein [Terriglobales bacterium]
MSGNWKPRAPAAVFAMAILLAGALLACKSKSEGLALSGIVEGVDESAQTLKVNHRDVPGFMDAMTMTYPVDNPEVLKSIKVGDSIRATVYKGTFRLYNVQLAEPAKPGSMQLRPRSPAESFRAPQLASSGNRVALAFGSGKSILVATSVDDGATFSTPVQVAEGPVLPLSRHRGPHVAFSGGTIVVTAVVGDTEAKGPHSHGLPSDGDLFTWRSMDGGKSWTKPVRINDVATSAREGLHTLVAGPGKQMFAAWLDLRSGATRLYGASSRDSGATWSKNILIYASPGGTICQCCSPSAAFSEEGSVEVMWRNALEGTRDLYLSRAADSKHFNPAVKLGMGTWKIDACPMDGGGMSQVNGRTVTAWRRGEDIFLAEPGQPESRLGSGRDVALAAGGGKIFAVWVQGTELKSQVFNKWSENNRSESRDSEVRTLSGEASVPSVTGLSQGKALVAWEQGGGISVLSIR